MSEINIDVVLKRTTEFEINPPNFDYDTRWIQNTRYTNALRDVIKTVNPTNILETGFLYGYSAFSWLYFSKANLLSIDPLYTKYIDNDRPNMPIEKLESFVNLNKLKKIFKSRFNFFLGESQFFCDNVDCRKFDLCYIDGDHEINGVRIDFDMCVKNKIPYVLLDDACTNLSINHIFQVYVNEYRFKYKILYGYKYGGKDDKADVNSLLLKLI